MQGHAAGVVYLIPCRFGPEEWVGAPPYEQGLVADIGVLLAHQRDKAAVCVWLWPNRSAGECSGQRGMLRSPGLYAVIYLALKATTTRENFVQSCSSSSKWAAASEAEQPLSMT